MARLANICALVASLGFFAWAVPLTRLFDAFQPMITALSIMVAAVFVRLNRGMPTLEWKSVEAGDRSDLTARIVNIAEEYGYIIGLNGMLLLVLVALSVVGKSAMDADWPGWLHRVTSGVIGGVGALCAARMAYVVWRDIDVVRLQKRLIDAAASREEDEKQSALADEKVTSIRTANLQKVEVAQPKAWGD